MPLNISWQQILLHLFNFVILFGILYILLYKPVKEFMAKRAQHYEQLDQQAKDALAQAQADKAELERRLANAEAEIKERKAQAQAEINASTEEQLSQAHVQAEQILKKANAEAQAQRKEIINGAQGEIAKLASKAAEKLTLTSTTHAYDLFLDSVEGSGKHE
jgi:F-type H+-transporting ATPase subunit b